MMTKIISRPPLLLSTLVFFDVETTGLITDRFKPEITELCMLAVSRFALEQKAEPIRVKNKLVLCFHPMHTMNSVASKVSGLNRQNLFHQKNFDTTAVLLIKSFLARLDPPVCLLAHNGHRFDYVLLKQYLQSATDRSEEASTLLDFDGLPIVAADTLSLFKALIDRLAPISTSLDDSGISTSQENGYLSTPLAHSSPQKPAICSFHLGDVYSRVFGETHQMSHSAEGDCVALLDLIRHIGLPAIDWLQTNYTPFNEITPPVVDVYKDSLLQNDFPYRTLNTSTTTDDFAKCAASIEDCNLK